MYSQHSIETGNEKQMNQSFQKSFHSSQLIVFPFDFLCNRANGDNRQFTAAVSLLQEAYMMFKLFYYVLPWIIQL